MKTATKLAAQGDVIFRRVEVLPNGYEETEDKIVAHSETGHHHTVHGDLQRYTSQTGCRLCEGPKEDWQVYCGAACCTLWEEFKVRNKGDYDEFMRRNKKE